MAVLASAMAATGRNLGPERTGSLDTSGDRLLLVPFSALFGLVAVVAMVVAAWLAGTTRIRAPRASRAKGALRALAGAASLCSLLAAAFAALIGLWAASYAITEPDPTVPDGDPCCGHPDTYSQVAEAAAFGLLCALAATALLVVSVILARASAGGVPVSWRGRWWYGAAIGTATISVTATFAWVVVAAWSRGDFP